jgi:hypothetical protein
MVRWNDQEVDPAAQLGAYKAITGVQLALLQ